MTCREKLKINHPSAISENAPGGCVGCPYDYGYAGKPYYCTSPVTCEECWDREVEEVKEEKEKKKMTVEELVQVLDKKSFFKVKEPHKKNCIYQSIDGTNWEKIKERNVMQVNHDIDGFIIYVAPPVGKDS